MVGLVALVASFCIRNMLMILLYQGVCVCVCVCVCTRTCVRVCVSVHESVQFIDAYMCLRAHVLVGGECASVSLVQYPMVTSFKYVYVQLHFSLCAL